MPALAMFFTAVPLLFALFLAPRCLGQAPVLLTCLSSPRRNPNAIRTPDELRGDCQAVVTAMMAAGVEWGRSQLCTDESPVGWPSPSFSMPLFFTCFNATPTPLLYRRVVKMLWDATTPRVNPTLDQVFKSAYRNAGEGRTPAIMFLSLSEKPVGLPGTVDNFLRRWDSCMEDTAILPRQPPLPAPDTSRRLAGIITGFSATFQDTSSSAGRRSLMDGGGYGGTLPGPDGLCNVIDTTSGPADTSIGSLLDTGGVSIRLVPANSSLPWWIAEAPGKYVYVIPYATPEYTSIYFPNGKESPLAVELRNWIQTGGIVFVTSSSNTDLYEDWYCKASMQVLSSLLDEDACICDPEAISDHSATYWAEFNTDAAESVFGGQNYDKLLEMAVGMKLDPAPVGGIPIRCPESTTSFDLLPIMAGFEASFTDADGNPILSSSLAQTGTSLARAWKVGSGWVIHMTSILPPTPDQGSVPQDQYDFWKAFTCTIFNMLPPMEDQITFINNTNVWTLPPQYSLLGGDGEYQFPDSWSRLTSLTRIALTEAGMGANVSGSLPEAWRTLRNLQVFTVDSRHLGGTLPESWSALTSMTNLRMAHNLLFGTLPSSWSTWSNISALGLMANTGLSGQLPASWSAMHQLDVLSLNECSFTGSIPAEWGEGMRSIEVLALQGNDLSGTLPDSLGTGPAALTLKTLALQNNAFSGPCPAAWSGLTGLTWLSLNNNDLEGQLPSAWSAIMQLSALDVHTNKLTGPLPSSFSTMTELESLIAYSNAFSQDLPTAWSVLGSLSWLALQNNVLTGKLPIEYTALEKLGYVNIEFNKMSGTVPVQWSSITALTNLNYKQDGSKPVKPYPGQPL